MLFYNQEETIRKTFRQTGGFPPYVGELHVLLTNLGPISYRVLTFICFYFSSLNFLEIVKRYTKCSEHHAMLFTILFTILPFNLARIAAIDLPYTLSLTIFLIAWRIYPKNLVISLTCFFVSFLTQSLLLFMLIVFLSELTIRAKSEVTKELMLKLSSLLVLPIVYWVIKKIFFQPYGAYEGYNQNISFENILIPVKTMIRDLLSFTTFLPLNLFLFLATYTVLNRIDIKNLGHQQKLKFGCIGLVTLAISVLPYLLLGLAPTFKDWDSRHQLLMPFGASLLIGGIVIGRTRIHKIALALIVSISLSFTSVNYLAYSKDWDKQVGIIEGIRKSLLIDECSVIFISDQTNVQNVFGRYYRFYEWNAMFKISTGTQDRFVVSSAEVDLFNKGHFDSYFTEELSAGNFKRAEDNIICFVDVNYYNGLYSLDVHKK